MVLNEKPEGRRELKRRQTFTRIAEAGLKLFVERGFDQTTLDDIAAASGISRRTFFYYIKSKEDVLLAYQGGGFAEALRPAMLAQSSRQSPFDAGKNCVLDLASNYETEETLSADRLLRSTETLRLRKAALFVDLEKVLADAMGELWPAPEHQDALRVAAMMAMGTVRLALDDWRQENAKEPLRLVIKRKFALLKTVASDAP